MAIDLNGTTGVTTTGLTSNGIDDNATSTAMTIDTSGNVLVGTTNSTPHNLTSGGGFSVRGSINLFSIARQDNEAMIVNRTGTDGDIALFRKDGSTVGSIGVEAGDNFYISDTNNTGLNMKDGRILPANSNGTARDAAIDLGSGGGRFKDLYISGGVYLGGTGSANKLDDYEEGTWTPVDNSPAGLTFSSVSSARYTKIGRLVKLTASVTYPSTADTNRVSIGGFPFSGQSGQTGGGFVHYTNNGFIPNINVGGTSSALSCYTASGGLFQNSQMSGKRIDFTILYEAT